MGAARTFLDTPISAPLTGPDDAWRGMWHVLSPATVSHQTSYQPSYGRRGSLRHPGALGRQS